MRAPKELRARWRAARRLRRAKRQVERALWTRDRGYGMGHRFNRYEHGITEDGLYNRASEVIGQLESAARVLEGRC